MWSMTMSDGRVFDLFLGPLTERPTFRKAPLCPVMDVVPAMTVLVFGSSSSKMNHIFRRFLFRFI